MEEEMVIGSPPAPPPPEMPPPPPPPPPADFNDDSHTLQPGQFHAQQNQELSGSQSSDAHVRSQEEEWALKARAWASSKCAVDVTKPVVAPQHLPQQTGNLCIAQQPGVEVHQSQPDGYTPSVAWPTTFGPAQFDTSVRQFGPTQMFPGTPPASGYRPAGFGFSGSVSLADQMPKKSAVPSWLREELKKKGAGAAAYGASYGLSRKISSEVLTTRLSNVNNATASPVQSDIEADDDKEELEALKAATINQEIKRVLTDVLLKVTDGMFNEIAEEIISEEKKERSKQGNPRAPEARIVVAAPDAGPASNLLGLASYDSDTDLKEADDCSPVYGPLEAGMENNGKTLKEQDPETRSETHRRRAVEVDDDDDAARVRLDKQHNKENVHRSIKDHRRSEHRHRERKKSRRSSSPGRSSRSSSPASPRRRKEKDRRSHSPRSRKRESSWSRSRSPRRRSPSREKHRHKHSRSRSPRRKRRRCSACFGPLGARDEPVYSCFGPCDGKVSYCSLECHDSDAQTHLSSGECHLFTMIDSASASAWDTADLRVALRFLNSASLLSDDDGNRMSGLLSNLSRILEDDDAASVVEEATRLMHAARGLAGLQELASLELQEAFCVVITNGVQIEVYNDRLPPSRILLGTGVYRPGFSWINHSCRPNACYRFVLHGSDSSSSIPELEPCSSWLGNTRPRHPRVVIRSIRAIQSDEEVTVSYTDLLKPKVERQAELEHKYKFVCGCPRCEASVSDMILQSIGTCRHSSCPGLLLVDSLVSLPEFHHDLKAHCSECGEADASSSIEIQLERNLVERKKEAIKAFMSDGDAARCCELLEPALLSVFARELSKNKSSARLMSYSCLEALLVLKSVYKVLSSSSSTGADCYRSMAAGMALAIAASLQKLFESGEDGVGIVAGIFWLEAAEATPHLKAEKTLYYKMLIVDQQHLN